MICDFAAWRPITANYSKGGMGELRGFIPHSVSHPSQILNGPGAASTAPAPTITYQEAMMPEVTRDLSDILRRLWGKYTIADGCWLWTGAVGRSGYGGFTIDGRQVQAHRLMYELLVGPIPDGLEVDHLCKNKRCVRPSHLEPVTHQENTLRGPGIASTNAAKTHCSQGHPFDDENTRVMTKPNGLQFRRCLTCKRERNADRKRRMREAKRGLQNP